MSAPFGILQNLAIGNHRMPCPYCHSQKKKLSVTVTHDGYAWQCFRCHVAGRWSNQHNAIPLSTPAQKTHLTLASHWRDRWQTFKPICGGAEAYLRARGCAIPPADGHLRCTESLKHPSGYIGPALVALVTDALTGELLTLHRTWIKSDGTKADVDPPRMLLGKHRKAGGVIRLWPDDGVTLGLAVGEGIETMLTAALAFTPCWSLIDADNLSKFPVLDGIESLLIAADNDPPGLRAADQCAERWYQAGREVRIAKSPIPGEDLNDYARRAA